MTNPTLKMVRNRKKLMTEKKLSIVDFDRSVKRLLGELCWEVTWYRSTNLSLRFGKPRVEVIREPRASASLRSSARRLVAVSGYWELWVFLSHWRIVQSGGCLATGSSSFRKKRMAMATLEGQRLTEIRIKPETGATRFAFDLDTVLEVRRMAPHSKDELWLLTEQDRCVHTLHGDGAYRREKLNGGQNRLSLDADL